MIFDIAVVIILAVFILAGYKKGFFKALMGTASVLLTIFLTMIFYNSFSDAVLASQMGSQAYDKIYQAQLVQVAPMENMPNFIQDNIVQNVNEGMEIAAKNTTDFIFSIFCGVLLFIGLFILLKIVLILVDHLFKLPVLKSLNRLAGLLVGAANGCIVVFLLCGLVTYFISVNNDFCVQQLQSSSIAVQFYNNNLLFQLFV